MGPPKPSTKADKALKVSEDAFAVADKEYRAQEAVLRDGTGWRKA